jgi:DNA-binding NtrC family response regulator
MEKFQPVDSVGALKGVRVLVVEDEFLTRLDLETTLRDAGAEIIGPCSGVHDALAALKNDGSAAAAILDVRLGDENAGPVARELVRRGLPFVFYTGQVDCDPVFDEWPGRPVLAKPALPRIIVAAITALLEVDNSEQIAKTHRAGR